MAEDQPTTQIDPDILNSLGIKDEDVQRYDAEKIELRKSGEGAYKHSVAEQSAGRRIPQQFKIGPLGTIVISEKWRRVEDIPDAIIEAALVDPALSRRIPEVKEWLGALGDEALLRHRDWKTAVVAYDVAMDGKIAEKPGLMTELSKVAKSDILDGVGIAKLIQTRRNIRQVAASPASPAQPAPETVPTT